MALCARVIEDAAASVFWPEVFDEVFVGYCGNMLNSWCLLNIFRMRFRLDGS